jgi:peroxiredoxin/outer membrane lipoprotein-sorting protein
MVLLLALLASLPVSPDSTNQLVGTWVNHDSANPGVTEIVISDENAVLRAHSWGACVPMDCDYGVTEVTLEKGTLTAIFKTGPIATTMYFVHLPNDTLVVEYKAEYKDRPDLKDPDHTELFERQRPDPNDENARLLLKKVGEAYGNLTTAELQFDYTHQGTDQVTATHSSSHTDLLFSSSGKWRAETSGTGERSIGISDGKTMWTYFPESNQYIAFPVGNLRTTIADRYRSIDQTRGSANITGSEHLGDVDCTLVKIERRASVRTLWIDPKTNFILKDDATTTATTPSGSTTFHSVTTFTPVRRLPAVDEKLFSFDPEKVQAKPRDTLQQQAPTGSVGKHAPDFALSDLQNKPLDLGELKGKVVLLDFWATWCVPCRAELPNLELLHRDFKDKGLLVLGVDAEEPKDQMAFMEKFGYTFRSLVDPNDKVKNLYNVGGIPTTVLIDKEGNIQMFDTGAASYDSLRETLRKMVTF